MSNGVIVQYFEQCNFRERRKAFCDWMLSHYDSIVYCGVCKVPASKEKPLTNRRNRYAMQAYCMSCKQPSIRCYSLPEFSEIHQINGETDEGVFVEYSGLNFDYLWNTRKITPTECVLEFDSPYLTVNLRYFYDTCIALVKKKIHFAVFYAKGQKCPHIRIYDLLPEGLGEDEAYHARLAFARSVVPMDAMTCLDRSLLHTDHNVCLEFSKHWRYGNMFKLMFEYIPGVENGTN